MNCDAMGRLLNEAESGSNPLNGPSIRGDKPFVMTRDPAVVASVRANGLDDVIGEVRPDGWALVYRWSLERWRARSQG